jgi:hypothetical protein
MGTSDDDGGLRFSLSLRARASSSAASLRRFLEDFGRDSRLARLVDDFVFFGLLDLVSFDLDDFSVSFPARDLREIELNVFLCNDFKPSSVELGRFPSLDFFGEDGCWSC